MLKENLENLRTKGALVHNITNYVTVNDVANILLAAGASPIMADAIEEVEDITSICSATVINMGTLNARTVKSMVLAGKKANALGKVTVFDPVGVGASALRNETAKTLVEEVKWSVIRGNISEIKTLALGSGTTQGVDADVADVVTDDNLHEAVGFAQELSRATGATIAITGAIDIVADEKVAYIIKNGVADMSKITGTGCMLTALIGAFAAANYGNITAATATAVAMMGVAGEIASEKAKGEMKGTSTLRTYIIDEFSLMTGETLEARKKLQVFQDCNFSRIVIFQNWQQVATVNS